MALHGGIMTFLEISGIDFSPIVAGLTVTHEPVWSTNAGRTQTAKFVGDIVAYKWKLQVKTKPLTQEELGFLKGKLTKSAFFECKFVSTDTLDDELKTITAYVSSVPATWYSASEMIRTRYEGVSFSIVEQ